MPDPYDYTSAFANVPTPGDTFIAGIKNGLGLNELQIKRDQEQVALARKQQMQTELAALGPNASPQQIGAMIVKYPEISEQLKRANDVTAPAQQQARLDGASQVYAALQSGTPDIARKLLTDQATAARNSGMEQDAKAAEAMAQLVGDHPELAKTTIGLRLAAAVGPDKFADTFGKLGAEDRAGQLQPALVRKGAADANAAEADAKTAGVKAKYADQGALLDLQKKGWDIEAIKTDNEYKRQATKIAYLNAQLGRETNDLKRQELQLKVQDAVRERDDKLRGKVADAESAASNIDNMLNTIKRVQAHPALKDVVGSIEGRDLYPNTLAAAATTMTPYGLVSTSGDERADAIALINTLGSQAFLSQVPSMKGQGSLSNAEGEKLQAALTNLSRKQSEGQFNTNLNEAARILTKARSTVSKRYGVPLGNPDTPAAPGGNKPPIDSFFR